MPRILRDRASICFRPAYLEANGDELSVESEGGKVVDDRFVRIGCVVACRLSGHADPRAGLGKDKRRSRLRNTAAAAPEVREVGGGWGRLGEVVRRGTTSPNLPQPPPTSTDLPRQRRNGIGANVTTK